MIDLKIFCFFNFFTHFFLKRAFSNKKKAYINISPKIINRIAIETSNRKNQKLNLPHSGFYSLNQPFFLYLNRIYFLMLSFQYSNTRPNF